MGMCLWTAHSYGLCTLDKEIWRKNALGAKIHRCCESIYASIVEDSRVLATARVLWSYDWNCCNFLMCRGSTRALSTHCQLSIVQNINVLQIRVSIDRKPRYGRSPCGQRAYAKVP